MAEQMTEVGMMTAYDWGYAAGKLALETMTMPELARAYSACAHGFNVDVLGHDPMYVKGQLQAYRDAQTH